ncbi:MAG: hypothetical protein GXX85_04655 [Ignavibacteria bacterium]|nr:hypothetical protein [Ignavibacteria bacterium]
MQIFDSIKITLNGSVWIFLTAVTAVFIFTFYYYRFTIPQIKKSLRIILSFLRFTALFLVTVIIFEPLLSISDKTEKTPENLIFYDASSSIKESSEWNLINGLKEKLENLPGSSKFYSFGTEVKDLNGDIDFSEPLTDFSKISKAVSENNAPAASVIIISDGIITAGQNPLSNFEKAGIPVFTIGLGDTSLSKDITVNRIIHNEAVYAGTATNISAEIFSNGFENQEIKIDFYEDGRLFESKETTLKDGINRVSASYLPASPGEKKISASVSKISGEQTFDNNRKDTFIFADRSKLKIFMVAGSPSSDLSFIKNSLKQNKNIDIRTYTEIIRNQPPDISFFNKMNDSADAVIILDFPAKSSNRQTLNLLKQNISNNKLPFLFIFGENFDLTMINQFEGLLPFSAKRINSAFSQIQPVIKMPNHPLIKSAIEKDVSEWENLPPVLRTNSEITASPGSIVPAEISVKNINFPFPLIILNETGAAKRAVVTAAQTWRWKLQSSSQSQNIFDNFINSSIKWLTASGKTKSFVETSKKYFFQGEEVIISGQIYNDLMEPVADADIVIEIKGTDYSNSFNLFKSESGIYEGGLIINTPGEYSYTAKVNAQGIRPMAFSGKFIVNRIDIEKVNLKQDIAFLKSLAELTGGSYFKITETGNLEDIFKNTVDSGVKTEIKRKEIPLWNYEWILAIIVLLFSAEWFLRKKVGLL